MFHHVMLLLIVLGLSVGTTQAAPIILDMWQTRQEVQTALSQPGMDVIQMAKQLRNQQGGSAHDVLFRLIVFNRAGMSAQAIEAIKQLAIFELRDHNSMAHELYYDATDHLKDWEQAWAVVDAFAAWLDDVDLDNRLIRHMLDSGQTPQQVDAWLAGKPEGKGYFWLRYRLRFNRQHHLGNALENQLIQQIKANPSDVGKAILYLENQLWTSQQGNEKPVSYDWIVQIVKPTRATDAADLARAFASQGDYVSAVHFGRMAIAMPVTTAQLHEHGILHQRVMSQEMEIALFRIDLCEHLAQYLLELKQTDEAQAWLIQAANLREKHDLGNNAMLAGQLQAASGQMVMEDRIVSREKQDANDPRYWDERAHYYRGNNQPILEEEALRKGLALTTPKPRPERIGKGDWDQRQWQLNQLANFLERHGRQAEAATILLDEIHRVPVNAESSLCAVSLLSSSYKSFVQADDIVLWNWLGASPVWNREALGLLQTILQQAPPDEQEKYLARMEQMATGTHPSRAWVVGKIEHRMELTKRATPWLVDAYERMEDQALRQNMAHSLFNFYLDADDWQNAQRIFDQASKRLTVDEKSQWQVGIALSAAKAGARTEAINIWRQVMRYDLSNTQSLNNLARAGLRDELLELYRQVQSELPDSRIPPMVIKQIQTMK